MAKRLIFAAALVLCTASYAGFSHAQAAADESAFVTWHASNFYPADFAGKPLPTNQSTLDIAVTDVANGKIQNLSGTTVTWYVDGQYYASGAGLDAISLPVAKNIGSSYSVRAAVLSANGEVDAISVIPVFKAFAVIDAPFPNLAVPQGASITLSALPYFFGVNSVSDLSFSWGVNGAAAPSERGATLTLNVGTLGSGQTIAVQGSIASAKSLTQSDQEKVTLTTE